MDLLTASLSEISQAIQSQKITAVEATKFFLQRIHKIDGRLNSYVTLNENAEQDAAAVDARIQKGEKVGVLAGVPFGIKDMFCTKNLRTTAASKILENFVPPYDATVVAKLKAQGIVVLGKLNQDEFAMGSSNETSSFGPVKNPWNLDCVPGGSSGGSAAAQSARLCAATLGTDTGGSIRQPASFCGIVGIKPTYGRVSRYGIVAYASSLDQAGPMVSSVEDAALVLEVISGRDPRDGTTSEQSVPSFRQNLNASMKGVRVGIMKEYLAGQGLHSDVQATTQKALEELKKQGAEIVEVSVPLTEYAVPVYYLIAASEASSNLARYDGIKYGYRADLGDRHVVELEKLYCDTRGQGFGTEVKRRIMLGTYCLSSGYYDAYYNKASQVRRLLRDQFLKAFQSCDVILSPVTAAPAFKIGERISDPLAMYLNDIFTTSTNLAGLPGMSVPFGMSMNGLPIGVQLTAAHYQEQKLLNVGLALENVSGWKAKVANVI
jgi:aspartyl-tRNA(Asn)/glutamyl-tRNA(Gln) amidotransferase subunit A